VRTPTRIVAVSIIIIAILAFVSVPIFAQNTNVKKANLQKMYMDYLVTEGYVPKIDPDGDVMFKREGRPYFILVDETDPMYFSVALGLSSVDTEEEMLKVVLAAHYTNARIKVCKIFTAGKTVWVGVQIFVASPENFKSTFERSLSAIDSGTAVFVSLLQQKSNPGPTSMGIPRIIKD